MTLLDTTLVGEPSAPRPPTAGTDATVLILAVGNLLMGDEGVGVHILRALEQEPPQTGTRLLDGGVAGINLLEDVQRARVVIMIDATRDGQPAGTVTRLRPAHVGAIPQGLSAHDFGLKDLFAAAALLHAMPAVYLFTISVEEVRPMCLALSAPVAAVVPDVVRIVRTLAAELAVAH